MPEPEPKPRRRGKTPTAEKVERRGRESWELIRRNPEYRQALKAKQAAQSAIATIDADARARSHHRYRPNRLLPLGLVRHHDQLAQAEATLKSFGIDADPGDPAPTELLDLLPLTLTSYD